MTSLDEHVVPFEVRAVESPTIGKLMAALLDAQEEFRPVVKGTTNTFFNSKYADLESIHVAVDGALRKHRIVHPQQTYVDADGFNVVFTRLIHESGEWIGSHWRLRPAKQDPQGEGSAFTYTRRYCLLALLGIATEDDDGQVASQRSEQPQQGSRRQAPPEEPARPPSGRKWTEELEKLETSAAVMALGNECLAADELKGPVKQAFTKRLNKLKEQEAAAGQATG